MARIADKAIPEQRMRLNVIWLGVVILVAITLALIVRIVVFRIHPITSSTMADTLLVGDYVYVDRQVYQAHEPQRGDIALIEYPYQHLSDHGGFVGQLLSEFTTRIPAEQLVVVRRVVGLPGETVGANEGQLRIDGIELKEPYARGSVPADMPTTEVPPGFCYVLCDNRDQGPDSRHFGPLELELLRGKVEKVVWSEIPSICTVPACGGDLREADADEIPADSQDGESYWRCQRCGELLVDWYDTRPFVLYAPWQSVRWQRVGKEVGAPQKWR